MQSSSFARHLIGAVVAVSVVMAATPHSYAQSSCSSPKDVVLNPFNKNSAHHRPIGTGAIYANDSHPSVRDWRKGQSLAINVGSPWGTHVVPVTGSDPQYTITAKSPGIGLPVTVRLPRSGLETSISFNMYGTYDGVVVTHDRSTGRTHEFFQYDWNGGTPRAAIHREWDIRGLGHGTSPGQRLGTSASGVAMLFGILRGFEINNPGQEIEHALQIGLPARSGCNIMLSREVVLPATTADAFANNPGNNTGSIPYGALMAIPPSVNTNGLGLTEPGRRLARALQRYGAYVVDDAGCNGGAMRADQHVSASVRNQLQSDMPKIYPHMRRILNNDVLGNPVAGGGQALAPNCAFDAGATNVATAPTSSPSSAQQAPSQRTTTQPNSGSSSVANSSSGGTTSQAASGNQRPAAGTSAAANWAKAEQFWKWAMQGKNAMDAYRPGTPEYQNAEQVYRRNIALYIETAATAGIKVDANTSPDRAFSSATLPSNNNTSTAASSNSSGSAPKTSSGSNSQSASASQPVATTNQNQRPTPGTTAAADWDKAKQFYNWAMGDKRAMAQTRPGTPEHERAKVNFDRNSRLYVEHAARAGIRVTIEIAPEQAVSSVASGASSAVASSGQAAVPQTGSVRPPSEQPSTSTGANKAPTPGTSAAANWEKAKQFYRWAMMGKNAMAVYRPGTQEYRHAQETYARNSRHYIEHAARAGIKVTIDIPPEQAFG